MKIYLKTLKKAKKLLHYAMFCTKQKKKKKSGL